MATDYISRAEAAALIVEERSNEVLAEAVTQSVALSAFRRVNVGTSVLRYPVLATLPTAQWLTGADPDVAKKPVTQMSWGTDTVQVEEAATIVIIPENVLDDATIDLWGEVRRRSAEAIGRLVDMTCFFGAAPVGSVPASFPVGGIHGEAVAAGNNIAYDDTKLVDSWSAVMAKVEDDGYDVEAAFSGPALRGVLRTAKDADGRPLLTPSFQQDATVAPFGVPITYVGKGAWDTTKSLAIVGDPNLAWIVMRQDITAKMLDQATVGDINLAEQDSLAMRLKIRMGFTVIAPKGLDSPANPYPFATLTPDVTP